MLRVCERFPFWIPDPEAFAALDPETQVILPWYSAIRTAEEAEMGMRIG